MVFYTLKRELGNTQAMFDESRQRFFYFCKILGKLDSKVEKMKALFCVVMRSVQWLRVFSVAREKPASFTRVSGEYFIMSRACWVFSTLVMH